MHYYVRCLCCWLLCFFFFKQKTAYEMRISDWSSDVCSSDLQGPMIAEPGEHDARIDEMRRGPDLGPLVAVVVIDQALILIVDRDRQLGAAAERRGIGRRQRDLMLRREIGRASWRERVCQYV